MVAVLLQSLTYFSQSFARLSLISSLICGYVAIDGRSSTLKLFLHSIGNQLALYSFAVRCSKAVDGPLQQNPYFANSALFVWYVAQRTYWRHAGMRASL